MTTFQLSDLYTFLLNNFYLFWDIYDVDITSKTFATLFVADILRSKNKK